MATRFSKGDNVIVKARGGEATYPTPPDEARGKIGSVRFRVGASQGMQGDRMHYGELFTGIGDNLYEVGVDDNSFVMHESWLVSVVKVK